MHIISSETDNCLWKEEIDRRKYFIINIHDSYVAELGFECKSIQQTLIYISFVNYRDFYFFSSKQDFIGTIHVHLAEALNMDVIHSYI